MSDILSTAFVIVKAADDAGKKFHSDIAAHITSMQNNNLTVEVQYQQSDKILSALILGREKEDK